MKKYLVILLAFIILMIFSSGSAMAAWTITPAKVTKAGHYLKWSVTLTSDGAALSATDLLAHANMPSRLLRDIQGETLMLMKVSPGTGGVIPNTTINVTLSDDEEDALFTETGVSKDAISWHDLSSDIGAFPPITGKLYLTLNDIGDSGDQVTLYFITWLEED